MAKSLFRYHCTSTVGHHYYGGTTKSDVYGSCNKELDSKHIVREILVLEIERVMRKYEALRTAIMSANRSSPTEI